MKILLITFFALFSSAVFAGNCTTTTRNNYQTGQVLTSSALNADFNQLVAKANSFDGGCVTDGTLEASSFNTTSFSALANGVHEGCRLTYIDSNTLSVDKCIASIGGSNVKTVSATNVTWGCTGCSSETASTTYYVYARPVSTGTSLSLFISTVAPEADGYDLSGNRVLGRFFNNSSQDIVKFQTATWSGFRFNLSYPPDRFTFNFSTGGSAPCNSSPCTINQVENFVSGMTRAGSGAYTVNFNRTYEFIKCTATVTLAGSLPAQISPLSLIASSANNMLISSFSGTSPYTQSDVVGTLSCEGYY